MSNIYCDIPGLQARYDERTIAELSSDNDSGTLNSTKVNIILDDQASELETILNGRWPLEGESPLWVRPVVLTKYVAAKTMERLYARRVDIPDGTDRDIKWADQWAEDLIDGSISLPRQPRGNQAELLASRSFKGFSMTSGVFFLGFGPTKTSADGQNINLGGEEVC